MKTTNFTGGLNKITKEKNSKQRQRSQLKLALIQVRRNLLATFGMIIILLTIIEVFLPGKRFYKFFLRNLPNHPIFNSN